MWAVWWVWVAGGFVLAGLEVLLPGFIFLGFAAGAVLTGALIGFGVLDGASFPLMLAVFAGASAVSWAGLRYGVGVRRGQVKLWDRDINE